MEEIHAVTEEVVSKQEKVDEVLHHGSELNACFAEYRTAAFACVTLRCDKTCAEHWHTVHTRIRIL